MIKTLYTTLGISLALASPAYAEKSPLPASDSRYACIENTMLLSDAQAFLNNSHKNPAQEKILISFGYTSSYVTQQEAITFYQQRTKHLNQVAELLNCDAIQKPTLTKTAWK